MINLDLLTDFIRANFAHEQLFIDRFTNDVLFVDIDCLHDERQLRIRATTCRVEFSTFHKKAGLDYSTFHFALQNQEEAEQLMTTIKRTGTFSRKISG